MGPQGIRSRPAEFAAERTAAGLSITTLAAQAHVSRPHLSNIARGARKASPEVAKAIANVIGCPVSKVFDLTQ